MDRTLQLRTGPRSPVAGRPSSRSRRATRRKPHEKSMIFGYLTEMVATIPTWVTMIVKQDELDIAPKGGSQRRGQADRER